MSKLKTLVPCATCKQISFTVRELCVLSNALWLLKRKHQSWNGNRHVNKALQKITVMQEKSEVSK